MKRFVSVGEIIVELFGDIENGYRPAYAGQARDMAVEMRARLGVEWTIDLFTALGDDPYSQRIAEELAAARVGIAHILKVKDRTVGLSVAGEPGPNGPLVTDWRGDAAARAMADDPERLAAAFDGAEIIHVSGGAFAILLPRARGRLLKALHRARMSGSRIVLEPLEWPEQWSSTRVMASAINTIATVADVVITPSAGERAAFDDAGPEAIADRYHDWGVPEVVIRNYDQGVLISAGGDRRWFAADTRLRQQSLESAYLAARAAGAGPFDAAATLPRREGAR